MDGTDIKFSRSDWEENERKAKVKIKEILLRFGFTLKENPDVYGVDFFVHDKDNNYVFNVEVEIKRVWNKDFPFQDIQIPKRRGKYAMLDKKTFFVMFNSDASKFLILNGKDVVNSPCERIVNRRSDAGEDFFKVPLNKAVFGNSNDISILFPFLSESDSGHHQQLTLNLFDAKGVSE
jgi:hypothetical protein